jgi:hypothetical protein
VTYITEKCCGLAGLRSGDCATPRRNAPATAAVVGEVAETVPNPLNLLDQQVEYLGALIEAATGREDLALPGLDGPASPDGLHRCRAAPVRDESVP